DNHVEVLDRAMSAAVLDQSISIDWFKHKRLHEANGDVRTRRTGAGLLPSTPDLSMRPAPTSKVTDAQGAMHSVGVKGCRSTCGVGELVGGVGVGEAADAGASEREQLPEHVALGVEALVVADEVAARVRRLVHVEGSAEVVFGPGCPAVV